MKYTALNLIPLLLYPFALQYLRTGKINRYQLVAMGGVIVAMGPRLLALWMSIAIPMWLLDSWLLLWMAGVVIWLFRHRTTCWRQEFTWIEHPRTSAERWAAAIAIATLIGLLALTFLSV